MRLLVTRPEPGAHQTARRLEALGHQVLVSPMLVIEETAAPLPEGPFDALAFTSVNGVKALAKRVCGPPFQAFLPMLLQVPAFAVGSRTAKEARERGFMAVTDCAGDASALAGRLAAALPPGARILHAAGEERAAELSDLLVGRDMEVVLAVLYRTVPAPALIPEAHGALVEGRLDGVLHFSPRTARALLGWASEIGLLKTLIPLRHFCLSEAVAGPLRGEGLACVIAARPDEEALLACLANAR